MYGTKKGWWSVERVAEGLCDWKMCRKDEWEHASVGRDNGAAAGGKKEKDKRTGRR